MRRDYETKEVFTRATVSLILNEFYRLVPFTTRASLRQVMTRCV